MVESLRTSPAQKVANKLAQELKGYSFGLQKSFCEPQDHKLSTERFNNNLPSKRTEFCLHLFKGKVVSQLKINALFQIMHYILTNGKELTPFHIIVAEAVHSLTQ